MESRAEIVHLTLNTILGTTNLTEAEIVKLSPPSSGAWEEAQSILKIHESIIKNGAKILDVGGGASEATARLLEMGADAYSIDPRYKRRSDLIGAVRKTLKLSNYDADQRKSKSASLERFSDSIRKNPDRYKDASTTSIPFPDNLFDLVFSINAIMPYLDIDRKVLIKTTEECLRVLKPGGQLQLFPYDEDFNDIWPTLADDQRRRNDKLLLEWAKRSSMVSNATVVKMKEGPNAREKLVIIKTEILQASTTNSL